MPKKKTHKGLSKRFKITGSGKVKRNKAGKGHLLSSKTPKHKRRLRQSALVETAQAKKIKAMI